MSIRTFFSNSINKNPRDELTNSLHRKESAKYNKGSSLKGRGICLLMAPVHVLGIAARPLMYSALGVGSLTTSAILTTKIIFKTIFNKDTRSDSANRNDAFKQGFKFIGTAIVAPIGQVAQVAKAVAGIVHPRAYFKKPEFIVDFEARFNNLNDNLNNHFNEISNNNFGANNDNESDDDDFGLNNNNHGFNNINFGLNNINFGLNNNNNNNNYYYYYNNGFNIQAPVDNIPHDRVVGNRYDILCPIDFPVEQRYDALQNLATAVADPVVNKLYVKYIGQEGEDAGGLSRDYIYRLFSSLATDMHLQEGIIYWQECHDTALRQIGTALGFFLKGIDAGDSESKYVIGEALHQNYFKGLLALTHNEINHEIDNFSTERLFEILCQAEEPGALALDSFLKWDGSDQNSVHGQKQVEFARNALYAFADEDQLPERAISAEGIDIVHLAAIKEHFLTEYAEGAKDQVKTLQTIARGMDVDQATWDELRNLRAKRLQDHIQGSFDREKIKQNLHINGANQAMVTGIHEWVDNKTEPELRNFIAYINGSPAIARISIHFGYYEQPEVHSCFSQIDIPQNFTLDDVVLTLNDLCNADNAANFDII